MFEAEAKGRRGKEKEAAEAEDGNGESRGKGVAFETELVESARGEAGVEDALDGVFEDVEDVRVAEKEGRGFLWGEAEEAAGEGVEAGDREAAARVGEDELLELKSAPDLLFDFH